MLFLKQSTSFTFRAGPFVDSTDGDTAETGLTINASDCLISKAGGAFAAKSDATGGSADATADGWYSIPFNTTDTGTLGTLQLHIHVSGALPVFMEFEVVPANVFDSLFSTDVLQVHVTEYDANVIDATAIAANAITSSQIADAAITEPKVDTGAITAAKFAAGAIDAAAIAANAIGASELAADAVTEIQSGLATAAALSTHDGKLDTVDTNVDAVLVDTGTTLPASIATIDTNVDAVLVDTGTTLPASIATVDTNVDAILVDTGTTLPASLADIETDTQDIQTKIGTIPALDGAPQTVGDAIGKIADDNGGADFDATTDSLEKIAAASGAASPWDALIASHDTEDTFGNVVNDLVQENGGTGVYEYKTTALANAPSGTGQTQYFVLGGANQDDENTITWHAYCLKNGAPTAGTDCTVQLYKDDGDGTITEVTGATDTVASPDANGVFNESMEVSLVAGALYYYYVTMTVDAATRAGFITLQVPERTAS